MNEILKLTNVKDKDIECPSREDVNLREIFNYDDGVDKEVEKNERKHEQTQPTEWQDKNGTTHEHGEKEN